MSKRYKKVYLTEKDSQVKALAPLLGCVYKQKWHPAYNEKEQIAVVPLQGHLLHLYATPEEYDEKYKKWNKDTLLCFPDKFKVKTQKRTLSLFKRAVEHLKNADEIIIATDFDNEGAALAMRVIEYAGVENKVSHMLEMGSVDDNALRNAINNPINIPYREMANAGYARAYLDWAEGMSLTRMLTYHLGRNSSLVLFGGVKTPIINMVVQRDIAFEEFKKIPFWSLSGIFSAKGKKFSFTVFKKTESENQRKIDNKKSAEEAKELILKELTKKVISFKKQKKNTEPEKLYDLTNLQSVMAGKGITSDRTTEIAQELYDKYKIQSYPRTDTVYLKDEEYLKVNDTMNAIKSSSLLLSFIDNIKPPYIKRTTIFNSSKVTSHGGLTPTTLPSATVWNALSENHKAVYTEVAKRYVSNFMPNAEDLKINGTVDLGNGYFANFSETQPTKAGWRAIYYNDIEDKINNYERSIPDLEVGDLVKIEVLNITEGETKPKPRFTEKTLMLALKNIATLYPEDSVKEALKEALKEVGLGTPSTRSEILKALLSPDKNGNSWLIKKGNAIISTEKARNAIAKIPEELVSPIKRAELNLDIKKVERGELSINEILSLYKQKLIQTEKKLEELAKNPENWVISNSTKDNIKSLGKCPMCDGEIYESKNAFICTNAQWSKNGDNWVNNGCKYAISKKALQNLGGKLLTSSQITKLLKQGSFEANLVSKKGAKYKGIITVCDKYGIKMKPYSTKNNIKSLGKCPMCDGEIYESKNAFICTNAQWSKNGDNWVNNGCKYAISKKALNKFGGKLLSSTQIKQLLKNKKLNVELISKQNQPYTARLLIDSQYGVKINFK